MKRVLIISILALLVGGTSGCGTFARNQSSARLYPALHADGIMYSDFHGIWKETRDTTTPATGGDNSVGQFIAYTGFILTTVDLPISFVTDTLLLPYDLWFKDEKEKPQQSPGGDSLKAAPQE